jgi:hypothetical protein
MKYVELFEDFENVRETQQYAVGKVIDEAQNYIEFLEDKYDAFERLVAYLNKLDESKETETKAQILVGFLEALGEMK